MPILSKAVMKLATLCMFPKHHVRESEPQFSGFTASLADLRRGITIGASHAGCVIVHVQQNRFIVSDRFFKMLYGMLSSLAAVLPATFIAALKFLILNRECIPAFSVPDV